MLLESVWRRIAPEAYFEVSVVIVNGLAKLGSWRMGFDRNSCFKLLKDACISAVQSQQWSFLMRSRRRQAMME